MPKMKTNKVWPNGCVAAVVGQIMHASANRRHNLGNKPTEHKRRLRRETAVVMGNDAKRISRMAPYL